jgi:hypothetical protein
VRNLLSAMLVSTLAMILSTASRGICGFSEHILWSLKGNGDLPRSNVLGSSRELVRYRRGGGPHDSSGTVFEISAKKDKTVIWNFSGQDGAGPDGGLIVDANGALCVTTVGGGVFTAGTVFRLTPLPRLLGIGQSPFSGVWAMAMMARIRLAASLRMQAETCSAQQNLGSSNNAGIVLQLSPPSSSDGNWSESVLWNFGSEGDGALPLAGLVMDHSGNLYGTTEIGGPGFFGTVFELTTPSNGSASWNESIIWDFGNVNAFGYSPNGNFPDGPLLMDQKGNLYGAVWAGVPE